MKLLHTGDLHIGKTVSDFSLIQDQKQMLEQIIHIAKEQKVDGVIIAGDVYDRSIPSTEAVSLLDSFLTKLVSCKIKVFMISGNHDSPERVGFVNKILEKQGIMIAGTTTKEEALPQVELEDEFGRVVITLMPFVKPGVVGGKNNQEAVELMLNKTPIQADGDIRNILITHYFVTSGGKVPELSDSETTINVGGLDNVECQTFAKFDYVALGHIHKPQQIGESMVYYAGTPIKYSFSETNQNKGVMIVTLEEKGSVQVEMHPVIPLHDMRKIKGKLEDLMEKSVVEAENKEDYIQVTLTNEEELIDPIGTLRSVYPNTMQIILTKNIEKEQEEMELVSAHKSKSTYELFQHFYEFVKGQPLNQERSQIVIEAMKEAQGESEK